MVRKNGNSSVRQETPVFAALQGPKELGKISRGLNVVRERADRVLDAMVQDNIEAVRRWHQS